MAQTQSPRSGRYIRQATGYRAFVPNPLPPDPPIELSRELTEALSAADLAIGRLDGASGILPNPDLFVGMYVRQEAVLSSQIEGTQASLVDLLDYEVNEQSLQTPKDVEEVVNYVAAMNYGLQRLAELPLSLRLLREIHGQLMSGVRGQERQPGEFRRTQNWIGAEGSTLNAASFVPPAPHDMNEALGHLELFLHERDHPPLVRAGLVHAQFETIHPFLDGNGRVGRLLITFMLCEQQILAKPLLYLSHYLKLHRAEYYDRLQAVRTDGRWEEWLLFFLRGVKQVADQATATAKRIIALRERHRELLGHEGARSGSLLRALDVLFRQPIVNVAYLASQLDMTFAGANHLATRLVDLGILREVTGNRRNRRFAYSAYVELFRQLELPDELEAEGDRTQLELPVEGA
jgi:Fic family protein